MAGRLTPQDLRVLQAIEDLTQQFGFPPSQDEIRAHLGLASGATVRHHLRRLEGAGAVRRHRSQARSYQVARPELLLSASDVPSPRASPAAAVSGCPAEGTGVCPVASEAQGVLATCRQLAKAQDAQAANEQLVTMVSHELRNPLATIITGLEVIRRRTSGNPEVGRTLEVVAHSARLLAAALTDILDLSQMTAGTLQLHRVPIALESVVGPACAAMEGQAQEAGLCLTWECQAGLWVCGHRDRLRQVVKLLIANAISLDAGSERIWVRCYAAEGKAHIAVARPRAAGSQAPAGGEKCTLGTLTDRRNGAPLGLGLALVKVIIDQHDGQVLVGSTGCEAEGGFIVELPLVPPPQ